jgi:O-antigen/teichoic acid export membrane protein
MLESNSAGIPLKRRALVAGAWSVSGIAISQMLRMGSNLVMTRLLVPKMFGVMAIAYLIMTGLSLFSDVGLNQNIIQSKRGSDPAFLNTVWVVQIIRGVLLWLIALGIALCILIADHFRLIPIGDVYAEPELPYVIVAVSFIAVVAGARTTKMYEANRYLTFGPLTTIRIVAQLAGLACMLAWVSVDRSIWALVSGGLFSSIVDAILCHVFLPGTSNRWHWDPSAFSEILTFGRWLFVSSIIGFFTNGGDRLLLASMVNSTTLGIYAIAFLLFSTVDQVIGSAIASIAFPALSEIVRKGGSMRTGYYRIHVILASLAYFSGGFLIIAGQALVDVLYDHRYAQSGWMLEILAVGLFAAPSRIGVQCYLALGESSMSTIVAATRLLFLIVFLPVGFHLFGLPGAVWGITLSYLSYLPTLVFVAIRYAIFDIRKELRVLPAVLVGLAAGKIFVAMSPAIIPLARSMLLILKT